jgi:hypothetical protein
MSNAFPFARDAAVEESRSSLALARVVSDVLSPVVLAIPCLLLGVWARDGE